MATATQEKKNLFDNLKGKIQEETTPVIQQKIVPVKPDKTEKIKKEEVLFSFYIPTRTLNALKLKALQDGTSVKELINNAINAHYHV